MTGPRLSTAAVPRNVLRLLDGRPQVVIRRRLGWGHQYLSDRMRGRTGWSVDDLVALCYALDVGPADLLDEKLATATVDRWTQSLLEAGS